MVAQAKNKLEVLWQGFEKTGSVEAYLAYFGTAKNGASPKEKKEPKKAAAKAGKSRK